MVRPIGLRQPWCVDVKLHCLPRTCSLAAHIVREWKRVAILDTDPCGRDHSMRCSPMTEGHPDMKAAVVVRVGILA